MTWKLQLAEELERKGEESGEYPKDWALIAWTVKALAQWRCERCQAVHEIDGEYGFVLTVHHLDGCKQNCELWNLAALCQRCHLQIQHKVDWYNIPYIFNEKMQIEPLSAHSAWMARHIKGYNVWAWLNDKPKLPLSKIVQRDYSKLWARGFKPK